jgi:hypothetical protein
LDSLGFPRIIFSRRIDSVFWPTSGTMSDSNQAANDDNQTSREKEDQSGNSGSVSAPPYLQYSDPRTGHLYPSTTGSPTTSRHAGHRSRKVSAQSGHVAVSGQFREMVTKQRRINRAGLRGVRIDRTRGARPSLSHRGRTPSKSTLSSPNNTRFIAFCEGGPPNIPLPNSPLQMSGTAGSKSYLSEHAIIDGTSPTLPRTSKTPLPKGPGNATITPPSSEGYSSQHSALCMSSKQKDKRTSLNDRIRRIVLEKNIQSLNVGGCSTCDGSEAASSAISLVETPLHMYSKWSESGRKYPTARPAEQPPLHRRKRAKPRKVQMNESSKIQSSAVLNVDADHRSKYLPGSIRLGPSFGLYSVPEMTAMDVLFQGDIVTDEQVMDDMLDFFDTYDFPPIVSDLDNFWLRNQGPSRKASAEKTRAASTSASSPASQRSDEIAASSYIGQPSRPPLRSDVNSTYSISSSRSTATIYSDRRVQVSPVPSEHSVDSTLVSGPGSFSRTSTDSHYFKIGAAAHPPTSLSPHWQAGARSATPPSPLHRRHGAGKKAPSSKSQSPNTPGKLSFRKILAKRVAIV